MIKNCLLLPYNLLLSSLNLLEDIISSQPRTETFNNIKIREEMKEEKMSFEELVMTRNFPLEIHYVETEDGYILKLYRIPAGKCEKNFRNKQKQSILLVHGIFDSSDAWVCNSEENCIPFILANLGFDVWLGNNRGNKHSRYHKKFSTESFEFWNFSFHEMGAYDLPAFLEHITKINKWSEKVIYIGHSQGTAQIFSALTYNLEYVRKRVKLAVALGPVARVCNMTSRLLHLMHSLKIDKQFERLALWEVFSHDLKLEKFSSWIMPKIPFLCYLVTNLLCDVNSGNCNNPKMMPVYLSHFPGGSSLKAISHFVQLLRSRKFMMYDYGAEINKIVYNSSEPKEYDIKSIEDFPIALFSGSEDRLANPEDVEWLRKELGENCVKNIVYDGMGHTTFMIAKDMSWFNDVVELIDMYL